MDLEVSFRPSVCLFVTALLFELFYRSFREAREIMDLNASIRVFLRTLLFEPFDL